MNVPDVLMYGHRTILVTIKDFPDAEWETGGACGAWSVKDVMGHLGAFENVLADVFASLLGEADTPYLDQRRNPGPLGFNDEQAAQRKDWPIQQILDEYNSAHERVMELVARIPAETFLQPGLVSWYGPEYSLDEYIVYTNYAHKREHAGQISVFRDRLSN